MGLVEIIGVMMVLTILVAITFAAGSALKTEIVESMGDGSEGVASEEVEEDNVFLEDIFGQESEDQNEYTEVPGPQPVEDEESGSPGLATFGVLAALVAAAVAAHIKASKPSRRYTKDEGITVTITEVPSEVSQLRFTGSVESYLDDMRNVLGDRLTRNDIDKLRAVEMCAKVFDSMHLTSGDTLGRITNIYIPAVTASVERIMNAPSKTIVMSLTPYLHRSLNVLKEAMEYELNEYQKKATQAAEAEITAVEKMAAMKNDTDDFDGIALHL